MRIKLKKPVAATTEAVTSTDGGMRLSVSSSIKLSRRAPGDVFQTVEESVSLSVPTSQSTLDADRKRSRETVQTFLWEHMEASLTKLSNEAE